jgi:hypothetical protein
MLTVAVAFVLSFKPPIEYTQRALMAPVQGPADAPEFPRVVGREATAVQALVPARALPTGASVSRREATKSLETRRMENLRGAWLRSVM